MQNWKDYEWLVVAGSLAAFFAAYGIGSNDVANAFATSVGARALTIRQAVVIAGVFEFTGSVLLGSGVTDTVRKNIAEVTEFENEPEVLMYGMMCVLAATGIWLLLASYLELPVSTTHSAIGGIIGMAIAAKGLNAVRWYNYDGTASNLDKFEGVAPVIISWVVSPVLAAILAMLLYLFVRHFVLRHKTNSLNRALVFFPFLVGITIAVNSYFIIYKGFKREITYKGEKRELSSILGPGYSSLISWSLGAIIGTVLWFAFIPWLKERVVEVRRPRSDTKEISRLDSDTIIAGGSGSREQPRPPNLTQPSTSRSVLSVVRLAVDRDVHSVVETDRTVNHIHRTAEEFDPATEEAFKYLQVFTAMMDSFGHGANDVANSIGPFAAIWDIYRNHEISNEAPVPEWILVLGGFGIVIGLATYGYKIIRAIGVKLAKISSSRGFAIELGAATVITLGSRYGIPLSTTHCQVGATVGIGLMEGVHGINLLLLVKVLMGWIVTLLVVGFTAAALFAQGTFSPSIINLRQIKRYEDGLVEVAKDMAIFTNTSAADDIRKELERTASLHVDVSREQVAHLESIWSQARNVCLDE